MNTEIPETMEQIKLKQAMLKTEGKNVSIDDLILRSVDELAQAFLEAAEEGHYDSAKLTNNKTIEFTSATDKKIGNYVDENGDFVESFKQNALKLELKLKEAILKVANS